MSREHEIEDVIQWARALMKLSEFYVFDTETTGFAPEGEVIQIGIADNQGRIWMDQLVKPQRPIENSFIHGITDALVADAPTFSEVYPRVRELLEGKVVVGYNINFDMGILDCDCDRLGLERIRPAVLHCAMDTYAVYNGEWSEYHGNYRWVKLGQALSGFGLSHEALGLTAHSAISDVLATLELVKRLAALPLASENGSPRI